MKLDKETGGLLRELVRLSAIGLELVISIVIGLVLGLLVDKKFGTSPWGMMAFLFLGSWLGSERYLKRLGEV